jgi:hypothetical protein
MYELSVFLAEEVKRLSGRKQASTFTPLGSMHDVLLFIVSR